MQLAPWSEVPRERRAGVWVAWYRARAISAHPDHAVLVGLMEAEGLAESVSYTQGDHAEAAAPAAD
jgi:hypothetical protein